MRVLPLPSPLRLQYLDPFAAPNLELSLPPLARVTLVPYSPFTLALALSSRRHSGLGAGRVSGFRVGTSSRWEFLIGGDPLRQTAEAENLAELGEAVCSAEAWDLVKHRFLGSPCDGSAAVHGSGMNGTAANAASASRVSNGGSSVDTQRKGPASRCMRLLKERADSPTMMSSDDEIR